MGACGGVCSGDQSEAAVGAGPHMFTGSIPPVKALIGRSRTRTGARDDRNRSRLTVVDSTLFDAFERMTAHLGEPSAVTRRIWTCSRTLESFLRVRAAVWPNRVRNVTSLPARTAAAMFSRRPRSSEGAVGKTNRSNGGKLFAGF